MTNRTYFSPKLVNPFYLEENVEFEYIPGQSLSQQQKSIRNMHRALFGINSKFKILEISTKSSVTLGNRLSAFNLDIQHQGRNAKLESVYQSTKVFEFGGPFFDIATLNSIEAKQDPRLKNSGKLTGFRYEDQNWNLSESPNFYDYLYSRAVFENQLKEDLCNYDVFTDFAYSNKANKRQKNKSHNCQARSASIIVSLNLIYSDSVFDVIKQIAIQNSENANPEYSLFD